jgi:pimeloyl-ACP methyl ester carboxylesterase
LSEATRAAVFVHGAGGGGWEWGIWARVFTAAGYRVAAPDLRPVAGGLADTALADYSSQVADWLRTARAGGAASLVLVGASLGGLLAGIHAADVDALVLVNPMPPQGLPTGAAQPEIQPWGRGATLAGTRRALPDADEFAALLAFRSWRDESGLVLTQARAGAAFAAIVCPVLVIASSQDVDVPPGISAALAASLGASLLRVPGSHVGPLLGRQAAAVAAQAVDWLNTHAATGEVQARLGAAD